MNRILFYTLTALLTLSTLTACGVLPLETKPATKKQDVQTSIEKSSREKEKQKIERVREKAQLYLTDKDYTGAIDFIQSEISKGIDEQLLAKEYLQAFNGSMHQADTLMAQGQYSQAALLYKKLQDSLPASKVLQKNIAALPAQFKEQIDICTEKLMEQGLLAYRSGEFTTAITIWEQVLEFNPQHQPAQDSIQTTKRQLSNLESIENNQ